MNTARRSGLALSELVIATLVLGAALIPMMQAFSQGKRRATIGKVQYAALVAARAELEELRQIPWEALDARKHDWRALTGHLFPASVAARTVTPGVAADRELVYPAGYERIETKLTFGNPIDRGPSQLVTATLEVRWQENGSGTERAPEALSKLFTVLACHKRIRGVR